MKTDASPRNKEQSSSVWVVILLAIVLTAIMLLSVAGGTLFRHITENRGGNMDRRASLSYVSARVMSADETGSVSVSEGSEGSVLTAGASVYFLKDGYLCEGKSEEDSDAARIAESSLFDVTLKDGLLSVTTDEGTREIYLHSQEADA